MSDWDSVINLAKSAGKLQAELNEMGVGTKESRLEAKIVTMQEVLWSAEAEYKRKLDAGAVGTELSWEELAHFMWERVREALREVENGNG